MYHSLPSKRRGTLSPVARRIYALSLLITNLVTCCECLNTVLAEHRFLKLGSISVLPKVTDRSLPLSSSTNRRACPCRVTVIGGPLAANDKLALMLHTS